jgi:thioredoxin-related protein
MILERLLIILFLALLSTGAFTAFKQVQMRRVNRRVAPLAADRPTLLYFRSNSCAVCPTQARYLEGVGDGGKRPLHPPHHQRRHQPDLARQYGVMTLPTTILLDTAGQVRDINYGLTPPHKLKQQLALLETSN